MKLIPENKQVKNTSIPEAPELKAFSTRIFEKPFHNEVISPIFAVGEGKRDSSSRSAYVINPPASAKDLLPAKSARPELPAELLQSLAKRKEKS